MYIWNSKRKQRREIETKLEEKKRVRTNQVCLKLLTQKSKNVKESSSGLYWVCPSFTEVSSLAIRNLDDSWRCWVGFAWSPEFLHCMYAYTLTKILEKLYRILELFLCLCMLPLYSLPTKPSCLHLLKLWSVSYQIIKISSIWLVSLPFIAVQKLACRQKARETVALSYLVSFLSGISPFRPVV